MKYGLLSDGDRFEEGDEMFRHYSENEWNEIPEEWIGQKVKYDRSTTFGRFNIPVRRLLK